MSFLFYVRESVELDKKDSVFSNNDCLSDFWHPDFRNIKPRGIPLLPFAVWWIFDRFHVFANRNYSIFLIYDGDKLIHRSCVFPKYFRFPFMEKNDLQIGDTWTDPDYRGQGLATFSVQEIVKKYQKTGRRFWYVVEENNLASIKVIKKCGFNLTGKGMRTKRFGVSLLGSFKLISSEIGD